jgi:hypothetical protein
MNEHSIECLLKKINEQDSLLDGLAESKLSDELADTIFKIGYERDDLENAIELVSPTALKIYKKSRFVISQVTQHAPAVQATPEPKATKQSFARPVDIAVAKLIKELGTDKPKVIMSHIQSIAGLPLSDWSISGDYAVMKGRKSIAGNGYCFAMTSDGFRYLKKNIKEHALLD